MTNQSKNYVILVNGEKKGPFSSKDIRAMITDGSLDSSQLVWAEGLENWTAIGVIPELFVSDSANHAAKETAKTKMAYASTTFFEKVQTSAKLAAAQARLEKLTRIDLSSALGTLGELAYDAGVNRARLHEPYEAIVELRRKIDLLREVPDIEEGAGMVEKTKYQANKGKRAIEIEQLLHEQKGLFRQIGEAVSSAQDVPDSLQSPLNSVRAKRLEIAQVESEIELLRSKVSGVLARPARILGVTGILILCFVGWNLAMPRYDRWRAAESARKQTKIAEEDVAKYRAESQRMEIESLGRRKQMEEEKRIAAAELEKERLAQKLKREEENTARALAKEQLEQQLERQRKLADEKKKMEADTAKVEKEEKRAQDEKSARIAAIAAQQDRKTLASKLLSELSLSPPKVVLSRSLEQAGTTIEMRGKNIEKLRELQQSGDWLGMLSESNGRRMDMFPDALSIESQVSMLRRARFKILLKSDFQKTQDANLYLITFPDRYRVVGKSNHWERHPDGIGYFHEWTPEDGPVIIVFGNYKTADPFLVETEVMYSKELRGLDQKKDLGELTNEAFSSSVTALRQHAYQAISKWATEQ
jgi:hypothetical protein